MKNNTGLFLICIAFAAMVGGCTANKGTAEKPEAVSKVVAKVNGTPIAEEDLSIRVHGAHGSRKSTGNPQKALDDVITEELLYQQGLKVGLDKDPGYKAHIARLERQLASARRAEMVRRVFNTQVAAKIEVTMADAKNYYEQNANQIGTEVHLGLISFGGKEQAEEALKKIRGGAPFESVARSVMGSQAVSGREPWDLGFLAWDQIPMDFVEPVYKLKPGEVSGVVSSPRTGHQIFKLFESRKNPKADLNSMSGMIMNRLRDKKVVDAYDQYVRQLKKDAKIEKF